MMWWCVGPGREAARPVVRRVTLPTVVRIHYLPRRSDSVSGRASRLQRRSLLSHGLPPTTRGQAMRQSPRSAHPQDASECRICVEHHESGTLVPLIWPSLCRQPARITANNGELSRMRIRRWRACTNKCEPSRTGLQSPCKRAVVSSILTGGSPENTCRAAENAVSAQA